MAVQDIEGAQRYFAAKLAYTTGPHELAHRLQTDRDIVVVDVRLPSDYRAGHIPGSINLPQGKWDRPTGVRKDALNILYCYSQTCHLAAEAGVRLATQGYPVVEMEGGFPAWQANGGSVETERRADVSAAS